MLCFVPMLQPRPKATLQTEQAACSRGQRQCPPQAPARPAQGSTSLAGGRAAGSWWLCLPGACGAAAWADGRQ